MKVLLVHAGIEGSSFPEPGRRPRLIWLHHGLASIASSARRPGRAVGLVDLRQVSSWDEFRKEVVKFSPDVAGLSMMSVDYGAVMEAVKIIKDTDSGIRTVVGGAHPTVATDEVSGNKDIDHIIRGEGEISFSALLDDLEAGKAPPKVIAGVKPELESLPFADRDIFKLGEMPIDHFLRIPFVTIIAGRGCLYNCSFCQPAEREIFGRKVRRRTVGNIIDELRSLRDKYDFQSLMIHDDCLTEDKAWVLEFCDKYRSSAFRQPFVCQSRADIICRNEDMVSKMAKAGLAMFLVGFESGNQRILNFLRKGVTVSENYRANDICKRYGIRVWANYMLGIPTETKEEALDTLRMIKRIKPYRASPAFYTPHPGSDLYRYCVENGLSLVKDHRDYSRSPTGAKIRGVDYVFLNKVLEESVRMPFLVKFRRKADHIIERKIKKHLRKFRKKLRAQG